MEDGQENNNKGLRIIGPESVQLGNNGPARAVSMDYRSVLLALPQNLEAGIWKHVSRELNIGMIMNLSCRRVSMRKR